MPIERCPTFRDQPPGSTATYNGKCYIFYNSAPTNFQQAMEFCNARGGTLVDDSNPALQGFLSWELWRRHKVRACLGRDNICDVPKVKEIHVSYSDPIISALFKRFLK